MHTRFSARSRNGRNRMLFLATVLCAAHIDTSDRALYCHRAPLSRPRFGPRAQCAYPYHVPQYLKEFPWLEAEIEQDPPWALAKQKLRRELTTTLIDAICVLVVKGNIASSASDQMLVSRSSYYSWRKRGAHQPDTIYGYFARALTIAEAMRDRIMLTKMLEIAEVKEDWRALQWTLKKMNKEDYGDELPQRTVALASTDFDIKALEENLSNAEIEQLTKILAKIPNPGSEETPSETEAAGFHEGDLPRLSSELAPPADRGET